MFLAELTGLKVLGYAILAYLGWVLGAIIVFVGFVVIVAVMYFGGLGLLSLLEKVYDFCSWIQSLVLRPFRRRSGKV